MLNYDFTTLERITITISGMLELEIFFLTGVRIGNIGFVALKYHCFRSIPSKFMGTL